MNDVTKLYAKVEKYGSWQKVPADRIYSIAEEVISSSSNGFVSPKRGWWAREFAAETFQVVKLDALKGAAYGLSYGLSLPYVPYPYLPRAKWHRSIKSASLDLREQPQVHLADSTNLGAHGFVASSLLGEKCFRDEFGALWKACWPRISEWFQSTRSTEGVLQKCAAHLARSAGEVKYIPGARLVRAFAYAKVGRRDAAMAELDIFLQEYEEGEEARQNLYSALAQVDSDK